MTKKSEAIEREKFVLFLKGAEWQLDIAHKHLQKIKGRVEQIVANMIYEIPGTSVAQQMKALEQIEDVFK